MIHLIRNLSRTHSDAKQSFLKQRLAIFSCKLPHWCACTISQARCGLWGRSAPSSLTATLQPVQHERRAEILASQFPVDLLFNEDSWTDTKDVRTMSNLARIRGEKNGQRRLAQRRGRETLFSQEPRQKVLLNDSQECSHPTAWGAPGEESERRGDKQKSDFWVPAERDPEGELLFTQKQGWFLHHREGTQHGTAAESLWINLNARDRGKCLNNSIILNTVEEIEWIA